ncbi:MAG TPA: adenosine kinase [Gemmataceae bacterium]|nr:adenosine kinase [Gemmataceae bacterium]
MREFQLYGLGNALVDIFIDLPDEELTPLGFEKGSMRLVGPDEQRALLTRFQSREPRLVSGGSVANSVIAFAQLGGDAAFLGCVGDDRYGLFYQAEFEELGIDFGNPAIVGETTGTCVCVITPDAERTMRTCLAVNGRLAGRHVDEARLKNADWLFVEGYVFANSDTGQGAIREALRLARQHGVKVAVTCSEAFVVQAFGDAFFEALGQADLLFCNASEARAVTGADDAAGAFERLRDKVPSAVVTDGGNGVYVRHGGVEAHVPAFACRPVDLTGAGDMLAGAFLYGLTHGVAPDRAARAACFLAMKVITQVGARLHHGARQFWDECLAPLG